MSPADDPGAPTVEVHPVDTLGGRGAAVVAAALRAAVADRGVATLAVSGGSTPGPMFDALAAADVPWAQVHVLQVDERVAPDGGPDRNWGALHDRLLAVAPVPVAVRHPMPVGDRSAEEAADAYATTLRRVAGTPPVIDVVHLGIGADGHTASLVPDDDVLAVEDRPVAATGVYQGRRRVTLTRPVLRAARLQVWLVGGRDKAAAIAAALEGDPSLPATGVLVPGAVVLLDESAAES